MNPQSLRPRCSELFRRVQEQYARKVAAVDGEARFTDDYWKRDDGGGGLTKILRRGKVFEQAGVNFSAVEGTLPAEMVERLNGKSEPAPFFAAGVSLVVHPHSPLIPTTHANLRYLEVGEERWFGGGADLTPYYLFEEDARHFHAALKSVCDRFDAGWYPRFKKWCDEYFYLPHRGETRGVGGLFFDYLGRGDGLSLDTLFDFVAALGEKLPECYLPIVERRRALGWTPEQKRFQLIRRGRYVEFNLLYDRGTLFGLKTNGRTESILMSLPPEVRWEYDFKPSGDSSEAQLIELLKHPRDWA